MHRNAARASRFTFAVSIVSLGSTASGNSGVQLPLSQYSAGSEQATLVPNGNFSARSDLEPNGSFETADGWARAGEMYVNPTNNPPTNTAATDPYSAQALGGSAQPPAATAYAYTRAYTDPLATNQNYVISGYLWNYGRHDESGTGAGELVSIKFEDTTNLLNNISLTLEGKGANGLSGSTGRFGYILFNQAQVQAWGGYGVRAEGSVGTVTSSLLPELWAQFDNVGITPASAFAAQRWTASGGGNWSSGGNWLSNLVPNQESAVATLPANLGAQTVTMDANATVGILRLEGVGSYTINGPSTLRMDVTEDAGHALQGVPEVLVVSGNHTINAPLVFDTTIDTNAFFEVHDPNTDPFYGSLNVAAGSTLTVTNLIARDEGSGVGVKMFKRGDGMATVNRVRADSIAVEGGTLRVAQSGAVNSSTSVVNGVSVSAGAKLDLTDNKLIVKGGDAGTWNGSAYTGITGLVDAGRATGNWSGSGIVTSMSDATSGLLTTLAVAKAEDVDYDGLTFGGISVAVGDVLVMYTWGGDAEMDGDLDGDDYFWIDSNIGQSGTVFGYHFGDFDYDGDIDGDDYFIIDSNIAFAQTQPNFPTGAGAALAAVPEPNMAAMIALAASALPLRRRRRR